jgi:glycine/D-amino acid oxidase-like deaminating enzyme
MEAQWTGDVVIFGGGISGLWALERLKKAGYSALLLESQALGARQTIASQGIIHGGTKYTLTGKVSDSAEAIGAMPQIWKDCLEGKGEIDLQAVKTLSSAQYLWSAGALRSKVATFFAGQLMKSRVESLVGEDRPQIFQNPAFKGSVYRLNELVLDVHSLLEKFSKENHDSLLKIDWPKGIQIDRARKRVRLTSPGGNSLTLQARAIIFLAGKGNEALLNSVGLKHEIEMQRRPLKMLMIKGKALPPLYAHCIDASSVPRLTITTHEAKSGDQVWWIGGKPAEEGVGKPLQEVLKSLKKELKSLLPWMNYALVEATSFSISRAEPLNEDGKRPTQSALSEKDGIWCGWPTKLTLAPQLATKVLKMSEKQLGAPRKASLSAESHSIFQAWARPEIASYPWDAPSLEWNSFED